MKHVFASSPRVAIHGYESLAISIYIDSPGQYRLSAGLVAEAARVADDAGWHDEAESLRDWADSIMDTGTIPSDMSYDLEAFIGNPPAAMPEWGPTDEES